MIFILIWYFIRFALLFNKVDEKNKVSFVNDMKTRYS